jgi:hypothetical protein
MYVREERLEEPRDPDGRPLRTVANREAWQAESDRLADWFLTLQPSVQKKLTVCVVRCPTKGCLLGRLFRRGDPRGTVRYVWLGVTWSGRGTAGIVNWPWDFDRGYKDFMVVGCSHGTGNVEIGLLTEMFEALDFRPADSPDDWLQNFHEVVQRAYARRTVILPDSHWKAWAQPQGVMR